MQVPVQLFSQQKPSTQAFDVHSLAPKQADPGYFLPAQAPSEQVLPVRQSSSLVQRVLHAVAEAQTRPPEHDVGIAAEHVPFLHAPSPL